MTRFLFISLLIFSFNNSAFSEDVVNFYRTELFTYGGIPVNSDPNKEIKILVNIAYAVGYSEELKNPVWVVYRVGNMKTDFSVPKWERPFGFDIDTRTEAKVSHDDYTGSGFDRGHMAPNSMILAQYGQMDQLETFLMSNVCPQRSILNRHIWANLEKKVREELSQDDTNNKEVHDLFVITGPIFETEPPEKLASGISIPTSFYKIIAFKKGFGGTVKAIAFKFPQEPNSNNFLDFVTRSMRLKNRQG